ncbi:hypothetical protein C8J57DRAFT_1065633 [Mycena rebaudengoi]|nr:hypothetical protein C8J57DRAFT_1065633 [Mycena rebaudengoi]
MVVTLELEIRTELGNISQNQPNFQDCKPVSAVRFEWDVDKGTAVERKEIFDWLSPPNFFARQAQIFATRQKGTGLWFIQGRQFQDWISAPGGTLWCHGIPGAGKTVLTSIVVDYLRNELQGNSTGVAAAYLNHKESEAQSPSNILAGLWWQLVSKRPISPVVRQLYEKHKNQRTRPSLDEVCHILTATTAEYSKLFFVVDALDEYPEAHREILLKALAAMGKSVSLMLTSRPNITPKAFFSTASVLEISAKDEDIRSYVKAQIQSSFYLSKHVRARQELCEEIEKKIAEKADGMFLITKLHIDSLATKNTVKAVRDALQNLPEDLEHTVTYDEAMDRIEAQNKEDREIARRTLIWLAPSDPDPEIKDSNSRPELFSVSGDSEIGSANAESLSGSEVLPFYNGHMLGGEYGNTVSAPGGEESSMQLFMENGADGRASIPLRLSLI